MKDALTYFPKTCKTLEGMATALPDAAQQSGQPIPDGLAEKVDNLLQAALLGGMLDVVKTLIAYRPPKPPHDDEAAP